MHVYLLGHVFTQTVSELTLPSVKCTLAASLNEVVCSWSVASSMCLSSPAG